MRARLCPRSEAPVEILSCQFRLTGLAKNGIGEETGLIYELRLTPQLIHGSKWVAAQIDDWGKRRSGRVHLGYPRGYPSTWKSPVALVLILTSLISEFGVMSQSLNLEP